MTSEKLDLASVLPIFKPVILLSSLLEHSSGVRLLHSVNMAAQLNSQKRSVAPYTRKSQTPLLARALLFAVLSSQLSTITASPLPSFPASAPGFSAGAVSAVHESSSKSWPDSSEVDPVAPAISLDFEDEDNDWELEYEDVANDDERMSVDGMGNAIEKGMDPGMR